MKKIFENLGDWDWFGYDKQDGLKFEFSENGIGDEYFCILIYNPDSDNYDSVHAATLADLLANPSWCKARWGEGELCVDCLNELVKTTVKEWEGFKCCCGFDVQPTKDVACDLFSIEAFKILQRSGQDECIKYIEKTMV